MYKEFLKSGDTFSTTKGIVTLAQLVALNASELNAQFLEGLARDLDEQYESSKGKSFRNRKTKKDKSIKLKLNIVVDLLEDMDNELDRNSNLQALNREEQELLAIAAEQNKDSLRKDPEAVAKRLAEIQKAKKK